MDLGTIFGVFFGLTLIIVSIVLGGGGYAFISIPSFLITMGGTFAAVFINYPMHIVMQLFMIVKNTITHTLPREQVVIDHLIELAYSYRKDGYIGIEKKAKKMDFYFMRRGINLTLEGLKGDLLNNMLLKEIHNAKDRHRIGQEVLNSMGSYAPAFGMIGTLIGLINMLRSLDDPSKIGSGMAVALLTTFYGALFANLICIPLAGKLRERSEEELAICDLIREGVLAVANGDSPRLVREKIWSFSSKRTKEKLKRKN